MRVDTFLETAQTASKEITRTQAAAEVARNATSAVRSATSPATALKALPLVVEEEEGGAVGVGTEVEDTAATRLAILAEERDTCHAIAYKGRNATIAMV